MPPRSRHSFSDGSPLTRREQYVLRQAAAGEIADIAKQFGEAEEERRLRARFLEELLSGELPGVKIAHQGIVIKNGIVEGPLNLPGAEIAFYVALDGCTFREAVGFRDAHFKNSLSLVGSHFLQAADFDRIKVAVNVFCMNTVFDGPANFGGADIGRQFSGKGAKFFSEDHRANFNHIKFGQSAYFDGAEFHGPVDFEAGEIRGHFVLAKTKFLSETATADLRNMQIGQGAHLNEAEFRGPADFDSIDIRGQIMACGTKFLSIHKVDFHRMRVGKDAVFQGCEFHGLVSFLLIRITGDFHLAPLLRFGQELAATFRSDVNLRGAEIGGDLLADKAQFLGHISNFEAVQVGRSFHASGAIFGGSVLFSQMQVRNNFYVDPFGRLRFFKTLFKGAANFSDMEVHGVFNADQAIFKSESTIFSGLKVGKGAFFNGTIFYGGLVLKEGQLNDLVLRGLHRLSKGGLPLTEIVLNRTRIVHRLTIEDIEVKELDARNLEVEGPTELRRIFIKDEADLRGAALHHLQLVEVDWPAPQEGRARTMLDGFAFRSITTRANSDHPERWPELLAWLSLSRYNRDNYRQLDVYLRRGGLRKWADKVHIAGKRRELGERKWWRPDRWLTKVFWDWLAGFGRKPARPLWVGLFLIILGAILLNPAEVLPPGFLDNLPGYPDNVAHAIGMRLIVSLYSLVAAIPGWSGQLTLTSPGIHIFVFVWVMRICGWILIPIGLAAVYTRLKQEE